MVSRLLLSTFIVASVFPASALADDTGFFTGIDVTAGMASGSSSTTDGGAFGAGGGVVNNVKFGTTFGIGGHIGYRFTPALSAFISYQHVQGDVSWDADFPLLGGAVATFDGKASSDAVLANLAYDLALSDATSLTTSAGVGLSFNSLSGIIERDKPTGLLNSYVADHTHISPMAQIGAGIQHKVSQNIVLGLNASVGYTGGFETGNTRRTAGGVQSIRPYKIDDVWRANMGASLRIAF